MDPSIVWLRRDLRLHDNVALFEACRRDARVCLAFVLDPSLLRSERVGAPIVQAFFDALAALRANLRELGSDLALLEGDFATELSRLARRIGAREVFYNEDYEPEAIARDASVTAALEQEGVVMHASLDHVYFGADEIQLDGGQPYKVFTPFKRRWIERRHPLPRPPVPSAQLAKGCLLSAESIGTTRGVPRPEDFGHRSSARFPHVSEKRARALLGTFLRSGGAVERYEVERNFPANDGTSHLSPHLRAGTIGIRECFERAFERRDESRGHVRASVEAWIGELIWREFYQMILARFPHVATEPFLPAAARIPWRSSEEDFAAWCAGRTGYPLIDAAMRQLNECGWMHNRLRMLVASFLTKDLLLDWRRGERYFEEHLADADVAQNNGGWQWAASTGDRRCAVLSHLQSDASERDLRPVRHVHSPTRAGAAQAARCAHPPTVDGATAAARGGRNRNRTHVSGPDRRSRRRPRPRARRIRTGSASGQTPRNNARQEAAGCLGPQGAGILALMSIAAKELVVRQIEKRSAELGRQVLATADTLHRFADQLRQDELAAGTATVAESAAEFIERVGHYLQESDFETLVSDAEQFSRERPVAVGAGGLILGLLASRSIKIAAARRELSEGRGGARENSDPIDSSDAIPPRARRRPSRARKLESRVSNGK
jgi:deoxyribodipyrimidine photo-lyase